MRSGRSKKTPQVKALIDNPEQVSFPVFLQLWNQTQGNAMPLLHMRIAEWLESTMLSPKRLLQAFRFSGKSYITGIYVSWRLFRNPNTTFIVISATQKLATRNAAFIRTVLEKHPLTQHLIPTGEQELWQRTSFTVNRPATLLDASVQALALTGDFTGAHADELIGDDVETSENSRTSDARELVRERIQEFPALANVNTFIGTPHAGKHSIYIDMLDDGSIPSVQFPIYADNDNGERTYAWPERFDEHKVATLRHGRTQRFFDSQYLLIPANLNDGGLDLEFVHRYTDAIETSESKVWGQREKRIDAKIGQHEIVDALAMWDPASGTREDQSVLGIAARSKDDHSFLHHMEALPKVNEDGWKPQVDKIIDVMKPLGITKIVVETNTNPTLPAELRRAAERKGYRINVIGVHSTMQKELRVRLALEATISAGRFWVHESVFETPFPTQAGDFPGNMKGRAANDFLDAAALGMLHLRKIPAGMTMTGGFGAFLPGRSGIAVKPGSAGGSLIDRMRARASH
jgi:hypothetical protein